jgi:hypothetical protein
VKVHRSLTQFVLFNDRVFKVCMSTRKTNFVSNITICEIEAFLFVSYSRILGRTTQKFVFRVNTPFAMHLVSTIPTSTDSLFCCKKTFTNQPHMHVQLW